MKILFFLLWCLSITPVLAEEITYNKFTLQAQVEGEVTNDQLKVIMAVEKRHIEPSKLAKLVNEDMQWALAQLKKHSSLKARSLTYSTYPVYEKKQLTSWRAIQQLEIYSTNIPLLNDVIGQLQRRLQIKQMLFEATLVNRKKIEETLIDEALQAFRKRAELIQQSMQAKNYKVIQADVNTNNASYPVPYKARYGERALAVAADTIAPATEAGSTKISVFVNGVIQLQ